MRTIGCIGGMLAAGVVFASAASGDSIYQGPDGGDWNVAGNWSTGWVPGFGAVREDAFVQNGLEAVLSDDLSWIDEGNEIRPRLSTLWVTGGGTASVLAGGHIWANSNTWSRGWVRVGDASGAGTLVIDGGTVEADGGAIDDGTLEVKDGLLAIRTVNTSRGLRIGTRSGRTGTLTVSGGTYRGTTSYQLLLGHAVNGTGVVHHTAGFMSDRGGVSDTEWGQWARAAGSFAQWNQSGGTNTFSRYNVGRHTNGVAEVNISGGSLLWGNGLTIGSGGTATLRVTGGTLGFSTTDVDGDGFGGGAHRSLLSVGEPATGSGLVEIVGDAATIALRGRTSQFNEVLILGTNGTARWIIDDETVTGISVWGVDHSTLEEDDKNMTAELAGTIDLVLDNYEPPIGHTYDLITARTINDNGFTLSAESAEVWALAIVGDPHPDAAGQTLVATYTGPPPPPGTLIMMR